jgi:serine/threonine-protein kinase
MGLQPGQRLGAYEVVAPIGAGGMGEVYRGRDTRLDREVAIKTLPESLARDPERLARLDREARALAALNHPNIAQIYALEQLGSTSALIMELVPGQTLADVAAGGPLAPPLVLEYASQMAAALEAAHEKHIVHRDFKPGNVMVTPDGHIKVLDFGLVGRSEAGDARVDPDLSPTLTARATQAGVIMGTAAYMSPEQAAGRSVDKRADIWAFGVVLWELLSGRRLFEGETVSHVLAAVLTKEPEVAGLPRRFVPLLERCLQKDPKRRLRDIGDAMALTLETAHPPGTAAQVTSRRTSWTWPAATALSIGALAATVAWPTRVELAPLVRWDIRLDPPPGVLNSATGPAVILSPDGSRVAWVAGQRLYTRVLTASEAEEVRGVQEPANPFFSPDGQSIGFFDINIGSLWRVDLAGGAPIRLAERTAAVPSGYWGSDGSIVANLRQNAPMQRLPSPGGSPRPVVALADGELSQYHPQSVGADTVVYTATGPGGTRETYWIVGAHPSNGERRVLQRNAAAGRVVESPDGTRYLVFARGNTLLAARFDLDRLELQSEPAAILSDVSYASIAAPGMEFDVARNGTAVYQSGAVGTQVRLVWLTADGRSPPVLPAAPSYLRPRISPDGTRIAIEQAGDVWIYDIQRETMTRVTTGGGMGPIWTNDGRFVLFRRDGGIDYARADGSGAAARLLPSPVILFPWSFSSDGSRLAYLQQRDPGFDLYTVQVRVDGGTLRAGSPEVFLATDVDERYLSYSPDGKWAAYASVDSGRYEVYVVPVTASGAPGVGRVQVSTAGGTHPEWSRTGRQIVYRSLDNHVMVADFTASGDTFTPGKPRPWSPAQLAVAGLNRTFDLHPDGKRIAALVPTEEAPTARVTVLLNFFDELKRRIP